MYLLLLLFIITCFAFFLLQEKANNLEHFQWDPLWVGKTSLDCYSETPRDCLSYSNCGLCRQGMTQKCLPGDEQGPFFTEGCDTWKHTNYYDRHIFGEKVTTTSRDWSYRIPEFPIYFPSPVSRAALFQ
ncbi:hypothetical protein QKU48_gp0858 [Fadolivirus algeromassiliense]|jgi:hypothetical protein|uniref:Uncharacterized protein n=1 Tax=Fadolivirus FV1/VV64 TaxID=3070911 RepID=A0A7D3V7R7_9VIRU|nr:hypothetical protein QKU48_gp0858 [Fadolivirus algeromassiliense]QKF94316.1 hypothetical protein Fadolivirus_1_858 [Fadolivirus FV1/VV64]